MEDKLYVPAEDPYFRDPYIDVEEWRDTLVRHYYVHGGFHGTDINGENEARFALYFPEKEKYEGRFFQYLSPAPESENATESQTGEDNKIAFALTHGAYFVVSNQGGFMLGGDSSRLYKVCANTAEYSRKVAKRIYEAEERPYGYVFGGSGGSFKVMGCIEGTDGVWEIQWQHQMSLHRVCVHYVCSAKKVCKKSLQRRSPAGAVTSMRA